MLGVSKKPIAASNAMLTPSSTRELLTSLGHKPRKNLGQNFLIDKNIVEKQCRMANLQTGDTIVEVGPGLGTLTHTLLSKGAHVYAVELDPRLAQHIRSTLAQDFSQTLDLLEGDAVEYPRANLPHNEEDSFKIVANLPYAITTPWMDGILQGPLPERMVLMVQKEAASRLCASPGSKAFSALSIVLQSAYTLEETHNVSRQCFFPAPDVDSALIVLLRREKPFRFSQETKALISGFFQQRRKQIGTLCRKQGDERLMQWLRDANIPENTRPEAIKLGDWEMLARTF